MIEQHLGVWLWRGPDPGRGIADYPGLLVFNALGGGAAPLFVTLAGIGASLMIEKRRARGQAVDGTLVRRGLVLLLFGLLLNLATPSWFTWRSWFVLHLMGFGLVSAPLWRRMSGRGLLIAAALVLLATPAIQLALGTPARLDNPRMAGILTETVDGGLRYLPWAPLRIAVAEGQFPIFPWIIFFLFGLWSGRCIAADDERAPLRLGLVCLAIGGGLALVGLFAHPASGTYLRRLTTLPVPFFPASPAIILLLAGGVLSATGLVVWRETKRPWSPIGWMPTLGRASLSLLWVHVYAFRELSRPIGLWQSLDATDAGLVLVGFTLACFLVAKAWSRIDFRFGAEWMLRKLAP